LESTVRRALAAFRATPPSIYTRKHIEPAPAALRWWEQRMPLDALAKRMAPSLSLEVRAIHCLRACACAVVCVCVCVCGVS
jgi:hypothetical protein